MSAVDNKIRWLLFRNGGHFEMLGSFERAGMILVVDISK